MNLPTFSICIPNYNYENYLGMTIESVLSQTYPHFEIIIVDNASTDNSLKVAKSYDDPRIKVYSNKYNVGFAPNLQIATSYATQDFINLLSSDDIMKPNALERYATLILENAQNYNDLILASDNEVIDSHGHLSGYRFFNTKTLIGSWCDVEKYESYKRELKSDNSLFSGLQLLKALAPNLETMAGFLTIVYSRDLWTKVSGYNAVRTIGPDKFFNYKMLLQNPTVIYQNEPLFSYRFHGSANTKSYYSTLKQQIDDYMNVLELGDTFEKSIGFEKSNLIANYLNRFCFRFSMSHLKNGRYIDALRTFFFSLASFPKAAVRQRLFYANLLMFILFPVTIVLFKIIRLFK